MIRGMMSTAILVLSRSGLDLARTLRSVRPGATIFGPSCVVGSCRGPSPSPIVTETFPADEPGVRGWLGPLRLALPGIWREHQEILAVMALGIVVRLVAPLLADKRTDPAVVVVDDAGRFAIAVLGGHGRGANDLAEAVAAALGAVAVVTTASDAHALPAVDRIGRDLGWTIERAENLTRVAASVVRREPVAVIQDSGEPDWWRPFGPWPAHFRRIDDPEALHRGGFSAVLVISDRLAIPESVPADRSIVYRPRSLVAGVGCKRGVPAETIGSHVAQAFSESGWSLSSLRAVATVSLKADEPGLIAFAGSRNVPLLAYLPEILAEVTGTVSPSEVVRRKIGIPGVSEPAALLAAGASELVVPKKKGPGVTVAIARTVFGGSGSGEDDGLRGDHQP